MTLTEAQAMTPEERRVKMAELMGYTGVFAESEPWDGFVWGYKGRYKEMVPDYCNDLNAVHEVAKTLNEEQRDTYRNTLAKLNSAAWYQSKKFVDATADQRTTALLLTLSQA